MQQRMSHAERTDLSDSKMLEAAVRLIIDRGTEKTTLKEVGEMAGYSRGLAGYRFGSKGGLFKFVLRALGEQWLGELTVMSKDKVGIEAIRIATETHYHVCQRNPDNVRAFYILWFEAIGSGAEDVRQVVLNINQRRNQDLIKWITDDPSLAARHDSAEAIAGQFSATLNGIVYQWLMAPDDLATVKVLHDNLIETMRLLLTRD